MIIANSEFGNQNLGIGQDDTVTNIISAYVLILCNCTGGDYFL